MRDLVRYSVEGAVVDVSDREHDGILGELPLIREASLEAVRAGHISDGGAIVVDGLRRGKVGRARPESGCWTARGSKVRSRRAGLPWERAQIVRRTGFDEQLARQRRRPAAPRTMLLSPGL